MKSRSLGVVLCLAVAAPVAQAASAAEGVRAHGQGWSFFSSQTAGAGATVLAAQAGFPGLTLTGVRGLQDGFDLGGRFSLVYAFEDMPRLIYPGLKAELFGRIHLVDTDRFGLGVNLGVGFLASFASWTNVFGITMPISVVLGIPIGSAMVASVGLDMPLFVTFGSWGGLTVPVLAGVGLEYFIDKSLAVNFDMRMGSAIGVTGLRAGNTSEFAFRMLIGVALKL